MDARRREIEEERHALATMLSASNISNADFHAALERFDREHEREHEPEPSWLEQYEGGSMDKPSDLTPRYTPEVKRAADTIRKVVSSLTLTELIALREILAGEWPIDPLGGDDPSAGVREPRGPLPQAGSPGVVADE